MSLYSRKVWIVLAALVFCLGAASASLIRSLDDCPRLVDHPERWEKVREAWRSDAVNVVLRHAADCDADEVEGCINGNEILTLEGEQQAIVVGQGVRRSLGHNFSVRHSYLDRTESTATLAFGRSVEDPNITKPCKDSLQSYVEGHEGPGNRFFVTHSSCLNSLKDTEGDSLLGINASKDHNFGIAAFFRRVKDGPDELLGCVWPADWPELPGRASSENMVSR